METLKKMKKIGLLTLSLVLLVASQVFADTNTATKSHPKLQEYVFNCTNEYVQMVVITIDTDSLDAAWNTIKTDKELRTKYSLDDTAQCSFRAIGQIDKTKKHHHPMIDNIMKSLPTPSPTPSGDAAQ
jgi:hypothetical protein